MNFSFDPQKMLGSMSQGLTGLPIIIGLPSLQAPVPNFVVGVTTDERARTSNTLPGLQLSGGDLFLKSARNGGEFSFKIIVSETPNVKSETIQTITAAMQQLTTVANTFASFGGVIPNLSGVSSNFAVSQISALRNMKDGFQPILALNLFMPLGSISSNNPFLSSAWYIEHIQHDKMEAERGVVIEVTLKETMYKRDASLGASLFNIASNLANELLGPAVGSSIGSVL